MLLMFLTTSVLHDRIKDREKKTEMNVVEADFELRAFLLSAFTDVCQVRTGVQLQLQKSEIPELVECFPDTKKT